MVRLRLLALFAVALAGSAAGQTCPAPNPTRWYGGSDSPFLIQTIPGLLGVQAKIPLLGNLLSGLGLGDPNITINLGPTFETCCQSCKNTPGCVAFDAGSLQSTQSLEDQIGNTGLIGNLLNNLLNFLGQNVISVQLQVLTYCNLYSAGATLRPTDQDSILKLDLSSLQGLTGITTLQALNIDDAQSGSFVTANPCQPNPCLNGGTCSVVNGQAKCTCPPGYTGSLCQTPTCNPNPCQNGGTCSIVNGKSVCTCPPGYTGNRCQTPTCNPNPCLNGGTCTIVNGKSVCTCPPGYTGNRCQTPTCTPNPCPSPQVCTIVNGDIFCSGGGNPQDVPFLTASATSPTSGKLQADAYDQAQTYAFTIMPAGGNPTTTVVTNRLTIVNNLQPGTVYSATVRVTVTGGGVSPASAPAKFTTPPTQPTVSTTANSPTSGSVTVTGSNGATNYECTFARPGSQPIIKPANTVTITVTGLAAGATYTVTCVGRTTDGTRSQPSPPATLTLPPAAPSVTAKSTGSTTATATAKAGAGGAASYSFTYTAPGAGSQTLLSVSPTVTISGLKPGTKYSVVARSIGATGRTSPPSNPVSFVTAPAPATLKAKATGPNTATLTATGASGASSYEFNIVPQGGTALTARSNTPTLTLTKLSPGTKYTATVVAISSGGQRSDKSSPAGFTTQPTKPTLVATAASPTTAVLSASATGANSYEFTIQAAGGNKLVKRTTNPPVVVGPLLANTKYTVTVVALAVDGTRSVQSNSGTFTTPKTSSLKLAPVKDVTSTSATLVILPPNSGYKQFTFKIVSSGGTAVSKTTTSTSLTVTDLLPGTRYTVALSAMRTSGGLEAGANTISFTTPRIYKLIMTLNPRAPQNSKLSQITPNMMTKLKQFVSVFAKVKATAVTVSAKEGNPGQLTFTYPSTQPIQAAFQAAATQFAVTPLPCPPIYAQMMKVEYILKPLNFDLWAFTLQTGSQQAYYRTPEPDGDAPGQDPFNRGGQRNWGCNNDGTPRS